MANTDPFPFDQSAFEEIEAYLDGSMLPSAKAAFEARMQADAALQREVALQVQLKGLSVREAEVLVRQLQADKSQYAAGGGQQGGLDPNICALQERLSERRGANVAIQHKASGKGK